MTSSGARHIAVLLPEVVEHLRADRGGMFLDCTFGGGGHTTAILEASPDAKVIAFDRDARAIERGQGLVQRFGERLSLVHALFGEVEQGVSGMKFDGILADLGMSTDQLYEERGFSFNDEAPLDMRMDETVGISAADFINTAAEREIFMALAEGGVGSQARSVTKLLLRERPFTTAKQLGEAVRLSALGKRGEKRSHPATVVFQALRMHVNREREQISTLLSVAPKLSKPHGRLAVITFHSIEDQLVAGTMRRWESAGSYPASWRGRRDEISIGKSVQKKPILPSENEVVSNPASRSARLRVFEFDGASEVN